MSIIKWTDEECQIVAAAAYSLRPAVERNEPNKWMQWCDRAQKNHLPNSRWRALHIGEHTLVRVMPFIRAMQQKPDWAAQSEQRPNLVPPQADPPTPNYSKPGAEPIEIDYDRLATLITAAVIQKVALLLQTPTLPTIDRSFEKSVGAPEARVPAEPSPDRAAINGRLPRVAIVGFDSPEQSTIGRAIGARCKLTFSTPHHHSSSEKMLIKISNCEVIFVRVKYISHSHVDALKKRLANKCRFLENQPNAQRAIQAIDEWLRNRGAGN